MADALSLGAAGLYPDLEEVRKIDLFLKAEWGIDFFPSEVEFFAYTSHFEGKLLIFAEEQQNIAARKASGSRASERNLMELMTDLEVHSAVASFKRAQILDGLALAEGLITSKEVKGSVLDAGCHLGVLIDYISRGRTNRIVGIDPVGRAIAEARRRFAGRDHVHLRMDKLPLEADETYELVICLDVINHMSQPLRERAIESLCQLVAPNGWLILSSPNLTSEDEWGEIGPLLQRNYLSLSACGILGGLTDVPPRIAGSKCLVLQKLSDEMPALVLPADVDHVCEADWAQSFKPYFDRSSTISREKTQAFEAANRSLRHVSSTLA